MPHLHSLTHMNCIDMLMPNGLMIQVVRFASRLMDQLVDSALGTTFRQTTSESAKSIGKSNISFHHNR